MVPFQAGLAQVFLSKSLRFLKCEKPAPGSQFSEKPNSARVSHNFQKLSDLGHKKNMFAGSILTMSMIVMIQHHFCLIIMNEKLISQGYSSFRLFWKYAEIGYFG